MRIPTKPDWLAVAVGLLMAVSLAAVVPALLALLGVLSLG